MDTTTLEQVQRWGVPGVNHYFANRQRWKITEEELQAVGIVDEHSYVHANLIVPLLQATALLVPQGYKLFIEDAYRSPETYRLVRAKVAAQRGEAEALRLFNMEDMPHATARAVDVALMDTATGQKVWLRNNQRDGLDASFVGFYRDRTDDESRFYQQRQDILHDAMKAAGFRFGSKREVWHFELPV